MSAYYQQYHGHQTHPSPAPTMGHGHHGGRNRRAPRLSVSQNGHRQVRQPRSVKEVTETLNLALYRTRFDASRSFDLEDDADFCPNLMTDNEKSEVASLYSASERSSLASNSPEHSPAQPAQVAPVFSLNSASPPFIPPTLQSQPSSNLKLHQPAATRGLRAMAIPIVNPDTRLAALKTPSPPLMSPGALGSRMQPQAIGRRW